MSRPANKHDRFHIGDLKSRKRVKPLAQGNYFREHPEILELHYHQRRDTTKPCSCMMCRNPRKNGEMTMQEQKFLEANS